LAQLLYNLRGVCRTWQEWVESQFEWKLVRRFGDYLFDDIDEGAYDCDLDGLPHNIYHDGYWDEY
jgi:hypothetical protein